MHKWHHLFKSVLSLAVAPEFSRILSFERSSSEESLPRLGIEMETPPRQLCQNFFTDETRIAKKFSMDSDKNSSEKNLQCKNV